MKEISFQHESYGLGEKLQAGHEDRPCPSVRWPTTLVQTEISYLFQGATMKSCTDIRGLPRMDPNDFSDLPGLFPGATTSYTVAVRGEMSQQQLDGSP